MYSTIYKWYLHLLLFTFHPIYSQNILTAYVMFSSPGTQYSPVNMQASLITTTFTHSIKRCAIFCTDNILCRVLDYEVFAPKQCRLFEGDTHTLGQIILSNSSVSIVGTIQFYPDLFDEYGNSCSSSCANNRYLQCGTNSKCECTPHTYWNASIKMCVPQSPILGSTCQQNMSMCREDLNYTCLSSNQCGRNTTINLTTSSTTTDSSTTTSASTVSSTTSSTTGSINSNSSSCTVNILSFSERTWNCITVNANVSNETSPNLYLESGITYRVTNLTSSAIYLNAGAQLICENTGSVQVYILSGANMLGRNMGNIITYVQAGATFLGVKVGNVTAYLESNANLSMTTGENIDVYLKSGSTVHFDYNGQVTSHYDYNTVQAYQNNSDEKLSLCPAVTFNYPSITPYC